MKWQFWLTSLGAAGLLISCSSSPDRNQAQAPTPSGSPTQQTNSAGTPPTFANPVVKSAPLTQVPVVPGLLTATNPKNRLPVVATGRRDPFASVSKGSILLTSQKRSASTTARSQAPGNPQALPASVAPLPALPLPAVPVAGPATPLPPGNLPALPSTPNLSTPSVASVTATPTGLAEAILITGAVQVRGKWNLIVKEPNSDTSRYVSQGERLANGRVLVKKIIAGVGGEPRVVLQQNGIEVTKYIGSAAGPLALNQ